MTFRVRSVREGMVVLEVVAIDVGSKLGQRWEWGTDVVERNTTVVHDWADPE